MESREKKDWILLLMERMNPDDTCAGLAGIELIFPAVAARPPAADYALAEPGYRVGRAAEIADVLRKTMGILERWFPLFTDWCDLFFELSEQICFRVTFLRLSSEPVPFQRCQAGPPWSAGSQAQRTQIS